MTGSGYGYWPLSAKSADGEITAAMWHRNMPHLIRSAPHRAEPMKRVTRSCLNVAVLALTIVIYLVNAAGHGREDA
ncbi:hypothetical protein [Pantoea allii]|uniref:hypothetical protein n=1 Tax=Pantoea allii TaxID=574096 RepID=UPI0024B75EFB|nr:hypothetical protein [Pantoea allii]MDJ0089530.1 hypothetical protein [Pantoea allii]